MAFRSLFGLSSNQALLPQYELGTVTRHPHPAGSAMPSFACALSSYGLGSSIRPSPRAHSSAANFSALQRKERYLQEQLQFLLDAQSEGLLAGLNRDPTIDASSDGSGLGTSFSMPLTARARGKQQSSQKVSLRGSRSGILTAMRELASVKDEELEVLQARAQDSEATLQQMEAWREKKEGLEQQIHSIQGADEGRRLESLVAEDRSLQMEIHELEHRLLELRAKQQNIASEISHMKNSIDAKLSSYQASLTQLNSQIEHFLSRPLPVQEISEDVPSYMKLPLKRRTLPLAQEHWQSQQSALQREIGQVEMERDALEDGAQVWEDIAAQVNGFEKKLRKGLLASMRTSQGRPPSGKPKAKGQGHDAETENGQVGLKGVLSEMDQVISQVDSKLKLAESLDWNLLVCCIGAELEALQQGRDMFTEAMEASSVSVHDNDAGWPAEAGGVSVQPELGKEDEAGHGSRGLSVEPGEYHDTFEKTEDEDEGPDPDLLVSHEHVD